MLRPDPWGLPVGRGWLYVTRPRGRRPVVAGPDPWGLPRGKVRHRRTRRRGWARLLTVVLAAILLFSAYGTGVSYAQWSARISTSASIHMGALEVDVSGPPSEISFGCAPGTVEGEAISFVRLWDPDTRPKPLKPSGSGAVKIDKSRVFVSQGPYRVDPRHSHIGDAMEIRLHDVKVIIGGWIEKAGEQGEYAGFTYEVRPAEAAVVVDVKAGTELTRVTLSGSGVWPAGGVSQVGDSKCHDPGDGDSGGCQGGGTAGGAITVANSGSVPAGVYLRWTPAQSQDPSACSWFGVRLVERGSGSVIFEGPLCDLLGARLALSPKLKPGESLTVDILVSLVGSPPGGTQMSLVSQALWAQWNSAAPGEAAAFGWSGSSESPLLLKVTAASPKPPHDGSDDPSEQPPDEPSENPSDEPSDKPDDGSDEPSENPSDKPSDEPSDKPDDGSDDPSEQPSDPEPGSIEGRVWEDLDGNGVTVVNHPEAEPPVAGVRVSVLDSDGFRVAQTVTGLDGTYTVSGLEPGTYRVVFTALDGFGFRDPAQHITVDPVALAASLGIEVEQVAVDDLKALLAGHDDEDPQQATTDHFEIDAGVHGDVADAAMVLLPVEEESSEETLPTSPSDSGGPTAVPGDGTGDGEPTSPPEQPSDPEEGCGVTEGESGDEDGGEGSDTGGGCTDPNTMASLPPPAGLPGSGVGNPGDVSGGDGAVPPADPPVEDPLPPSGDPPPADLPPPGGGGEVAP
jgi:hypothetical protein